MHFLTKQNKKLFNIRFNTRTLTKRTTLTVEKFNFTKPFFICRFRILFAYKAKNQVVKYLKNLKLKCLSS